MKKNIDTKAWSILGLIGGTAILTASAILKLIKNKKDIITEKQKELIGFSLMFSEFIKRSKQNITNETKKVENFIDTKLNSSGLNDIKLFINELITSKKLNTDTLSNIYKNINYSVRLQMFRLLVSYQKDKAQYKDSEHSLKEIATLLGLNQKDYQSILAMNSPDLESAYKILQVDKNASSEEIKTSFRRLSKLYHPDKVEHLGKEFKNEALKNFQKILDAYQLIKKTL